MKIKCLFFITFALFFLSTPYATADDKLIDNPIIKNQNAIVYNNMPSYYPQLKQNMTYDLSWLSGNFTDFNGWQTTARQFFRDKLLVEEKPHSFNYTLLDQIDRGSYVTQKIQLNISDNSQVISYLLIPKKATSTNRVPAAVVFHDHGAKFDIGKEKVVESWTDSGKLESSKAWVAKFLSNKFIADELAKRGYVVFVTDALGWGDRGPMVYEQQQALASNLFNLGTSLAGIVAYEDMQSVNFVSTLPEVDPNRIATVGFSFGAYRSWQTAALSEYVSASVSVSWFGDYDGLLQEGNNVLRGQSSFYMLHPGVSKRLDIPDIASLSAPKPILLFNGESDNLFPVASVKNSYTKIHEIWQSQHAEENIVTKLWPNLGHVFVEEQQKEAFDWLDKQFGM